MGGFFLLDKVVKLVSGAWVCYQRNNIFLFDSSTAKLIRCTGCPKNVTSSVNQGSQSMLTINGQGIEMVKDIKLLGTLVTENLKRNKKTKKHN